MNILQFKDWKASDVVCDVLSNEKNQLDALIDDYEEEVPLYTYKDEVYSCYAEAKEAFLKGKFGKFKLNTIRTFFNQSREKNEIKKKCLVQVKKASELCSDIAYDLEESGGNLFAGVMRNLISYFDMELRIDEIGNRFLVMNVKRFSFGKVVSVDEVWYGLFDLDRYEIDRITSLFKKINRCKDKRDL